MGTHGVVVTVVQVEAEVAVGSAQFLRHATDSLAILHALHCG